MTEKFSRVCDYLLDIAVKLCDFAVGISRVGGNMIQLAPSILAADFNKLGDQIKELEQNGVEYLHIDVMDGCYVPSISFGMPVIASIRKNTKLVFDVHLMVEEPSRYLQDFKDAGADIITVHVEACKHLHSTIMEIKNLGMKVGVTLNPGTSLSELDYILNEVDMVLIMSVNPGFGGQSFIPSTLDKIRDLKKMGDQLGAHFDIEVDGGVTHENVEEIIQAGANVIVSGSSIFGGNITMNIKEFQEIFKKIESK